MKISEKVKNRCKELKIPLIRYEKEFPLLSELGFSEKQINRMVLRRSSKKTVNVIITNSKSIQQLDRDVMTHDVITSIAARDGGGKALNSLLESL